MSENRKLALDIGNVLFRVDVDGFIETLNAVVFTENNSGLAFMEGIQAGQDIGLYTMRQALAKFHPELSDKTLDLLTQSWIDVADACDPMLNKVIELIDDGWEIALLSNIGFDHKTVAEKLLPKKIWDNCIRHFSCDVGARKPSQLFYLSFCLKYPDWKNVLFLDDREENVIAARNYLYAQRFDLNDYESDEIAVNKFDEMVRHNKFVTDLMFGRLEKSDDIF